jgi:hypothetical protein
MFHQINISALVEVVPYSEASVILRANLNAKVESLGEPTIRKLKPMKIINPAEVLERLLKETHWSGSHEFTEFQWKVSKDFWDDDFSQIDIIEREFSEEYKILVDQIENIRLS